jgi:hypothetical protein
MVEYMARKDIQISRDRVLNLMRHLGLRASKQKPRTSVPGNPAEQLPCVVDLSQIFAVDQVWAKEITYIRPQIGFLNLLVIVALCCRNVLDWKLS